MNSLELVRHRRSVRTFDGNSLQPERAEEILRFAQCMENPYGIPIVWKLLRSDTDKVSAPVIVGADTWIAGKLRRVPHAEEAFGYAFEKLVLHAESLGLGTTWIAGTMDRPAFERAMEAQGLKVHSDMILFGDYLTPEVRNHLAPAFEKKATAIVCANDIIAANVIDECIRCGLRVPDDMSVIGFDDIPLAAITEPPLTTIRQNRKNIGMLAMTVLSELCEHVPIALVQIRPQLIIRGSTAKAPGT